MNIRAADSVLVALTPKSDAPAHRTFPESPSFTQAIEGPWTLSAEAGLGLAEDFSTTLDTLKSWREIPELAGYAGVGTYRCEFELNEAPPAGARVFLDLGTVYELGAVTLNGEEAGVAWRRPQRVDVTEQLSHMTNALLVKVPNILLNYEARGVEHYPRPSGLLGPVEIWW